MPYFQPRHFDLDQTDDNKLNRSKCAYNLKELEFCITTVSLNRAYLIGQRTSDPGKLSRRPTDASSKRGNRKWSG